MYPIPNVPDSLAREIYADLLNYLPLPPTDTPEARLNRDSRAMAAVAALIPENAAEAAVAITAIATDFHAKDALAAASRPDLTIEALKNLRGMTASMSRQSQNAIRTLRLMQAERRKLENALYPAAMERSGHWFKDASQMVAGPSPVAIPPPTEPTGDLPRCALDRMDAAEQFAARHPSQAAAIRAHRGIPPDCDFDPPDPKLIAFIVASRSPLLLELDQLQADGPLTLPLPLREGAGGGGAANTQSPTTSDSIPQTNPLRRS
jgi:hypothetical protein